MFLHLKKLLRVCLLCFFMMTSPAMTALADTLPEVEAEGAVLMDAATGQVLYGKNENDQFAPASITKIMTALLAVEHCSPDETVTFSSSAVNGLESGAVTLDIEAGDTLTVEQCLYGLLLKSANEIGNGLAEHISGSISAFTDLMNKRAAELGCTNTHFSNPHGLNSSTHRVTAKDMALIMRAALSYETFCRIDTTTSYLFPALKNAEARTITMGHKMMFPSDSRYYEGICGGKTGYTSVAGNTLVTAAERNGVKLIAVVLKASGTHYSDTKALLDYGFANYTSLTGRTQTGTDTQTVSASKTVTAGTAASSAASVSTGSASVTPFAAGQAVNVAQTGTIDAATIVAGEAPGETGSSCGSGTDAAEDIRSGAEAYAAGWNLVSGKYIYVHEDGSPAASEWIVENGLYYWIGSDGYMVEGWMQDGQGNSYYFKPSSGYLSKSKWLYIDNDWYYFGADGKMLRSATTPDGYVVGADGKYIP